MQRFIIKWIKHFLHWVMVKLKWKPLVYNQAFFFSYNEKKQLYLGKKNPNSLVKKRLLPWGICSFFFNRFQCLKMKEEITYFRALGFCEQMTKEIKIHHRSCLSNTAIDQLSLGVLFNSAATESVSSAYFISGLGEFLHWLLLQPSFFKSRVLEPMECCHSVSIAMKETNHLPPRTNFTAQGPSQEWMESDLVCNIERLKLECLQEGNSCSCQFSLCKSLWLHSRQFLCTTHIVDFQSLGMATKVSSNWTSGFDLKWILILCWWETVSLQHCDPSVADEISL